MWLQQFWFDMCKLATLATLAKKRAAEEVLVRSLEARMRAAGWEDGQYVISGFPRSQEDLDAWFKVRVEAW